MSPLAPVHAAVCSACGVPARILATVGKGDTERRFCADCLPGVRARQKKKERPRVAPPAWEIAE
jgi:hypothetical protein